MLDIRGGLELIAEFILDKLREELEEQDHRATGDLIDSMQAIVGVKSGGFEITIIANDYAKYMEEGFSPGKWVNPYALAEWVERKGIATGVKEIKAAAFAIRAAIHREGMPTNGSYKFSKNGRRTGFIDFVMDENAEAIFEKALEVFTKEIDLSLTNIVNKNKVTFEKWQ